MEAETKPLTKLILTTIQESAQKAGLDKLSEAEIDAEIAAHRQSKQKQRLRPMPRVILDTNVIVPAFL